MGEGAGGTVLSSICSEIGRVQTIDLHTNRLNIREFHLSDAAFILELVNDPSFIEYIGNKGIRNIQDAQNHIQDNFLSSYAKFGYGAYLVLLKSSNVPIGLCGFFKRDQFESPDIGYAFLPEYRSYGYALEAAKEVLAFGQSALKFEQVLAFTKLDNPASARLLEKLGLPFQKIVEYGAEKEQVRLHARIF